MFTWHLRLFIFYFFPHSTQKKKSSHLCADRQPRPPSSLQTQIQTPHPNWKTLRRYRPGEQISTIFGEKPGSYPRKVEERPACGSCVSTSYHRAQAPVCDTAKSHVILLIILSPQYIYYQVYDSVKKMKGLRRNEKKTITLLLVLCRKKSISENNFRKFYFGKTKIGKLFSGIHRVTHGGGVPVRHIHIQQ